MIDTATSRDPLRPLPPGAVTLDYGEALDRRELTRSYLLSFRAEELLANHLLEAGRLQINEPPFDGLLGGWEYPTSQVRGHFVGHWLSAGATFWASTGDARFKGMIDHLVAELAGCQHRNGGEWVAPIPEKYLHWIKAGTAVWAPMYVAHKTLMGLFDAYRLAGNDTALEVVVNAARWFTRFTDGMTREELDDLLDWETGGIHELWADLYGATKEQEHLDLVERFDRRRLIDRLCRGEDALTNMHANQQVPEIMGAARAYEVTGDTRWRDAVASFWRLAVTERGWYATGGQTFGEYWTPPFELAARLGPSNQEHCVVFNMMRVAEKLLRWTGDPVYADYLERNRVNGIYAQQHPRTGMVAYYLPLQAGARKRWATPRDSFWCCVSTQVQAGSRLGLSCFYEHDDGLTITDYMPSTARWEHGGVPVAVTVRTGEDTPPPGRADFEHRRSAHRPQRLDVDLRVRAGTPVGCELRLRLPWWLAGEATLEVNGVAEPVRAAAGSFASVRRTWTDDRVRLTLPWALTAEPLPGRPGTVAFMDGPRVLAGLVDEERTLRGDAADPSSLLAPAGELELGRWQSRWTTRDQDRGVAFVPLNEITDETYTVYFPVEAPGTR